MAETDIKTIIVGGNFGEKRQSSIINKLGDLIDSDVINGGSIDDLKNIDLEPYDLILWLPNVSNEVEKIYPKKRKGAVLICSKVIREGYDDNIAITRIFKMHANAVISIHSNKGLYSFKLLDALGNLWTDTSDLMNLVNSICDIYFFTNSSKRLNSSSIDNKKLSLFFEDDIVRKFIILNKEVADKSEATGGRYFGNCSTRCEKLFPTMRHFENKILVSKRNVDKSRLTTDDLILCESNEYNEIKYYGSYKPSVDTPIQISLYQEFPEINFMIHGHYYIKNAIFTDNYFPCGDMREFDELKKKIIGKYGVINLKNHGFLLYSDNLENLEEIISNNIFIKRQLGELIN